MATSIQSDRVAQDTLTDQDVLTEGPKYNEPTRKKRVKFYRSPVTREELAQLNKRSDFLGFVQTLGFLAVLAIAAGTAIYSSIHWPWYVTVLLVFVNRKGLISPRK